MRLSSPQRRLRRERARVRRRVQALGFAAVACRPNVISFGVFLGRSSSSCSASSSSSSSHACCCSRFACCSFCHGAAALDRHSPLDGNALWCHPSRRIVIVYAQCCHHKFWLFTLIDAKFDVILSCPLSSIARPGVCVVQRCCIQRLSSPHQAARSPHSGCCVSSSIYCASLSLGPAVQPASRRAPPQITSASASTLASPPMTC